MKSKEPAKVKKAQKKKVSQPQVQDALELEQKPSRLKHLLLGEPKPDMTDIEAGSTTILDILSPTAVDTKSRDHIVVDGIFHEKAKASIEASLQKLNTDYIDLLLIHQPFNDYYGTYRAMEDAYKSGILRAIGVSNFYPDRLIDLCQFVEIPPMVNQVETYPFHQQRSAHAVMEQYGVLHESWGPFAEGRKDMFINPVLAEIGGRYGKSVAQVILRFLLQSDVVVIPKSVRKERMAENFDVFDFALSPTDMEKIIHLDEGKSTFFAHYNPATVEFLTGLGKN